jgi:hypothetical protein
MNTPLDPKLSARSSWLAKSVVVVGAAVALATSPPPTWGETIEDVANVDLVLDERVSLPFSIRITGDKLDNARDASLRLRVVADRAASDLTVSLLHTEPAWPSLEADAASESTPNDPYGESLQTATPALPDVDRVSFYSPLRCPNPDIRESVNGPCVDRYLLEATRQSTQGAKLRLEFEVRVQGSAEKAPPGEILVEVGSP